MAASHTTQSAGPEVATVLTDALTGYDNHSVEMLISVSSERRTGHSHCRVVLSHLVQCAEARSSHACARIASHHIPCGTSVHVNCSNCTAVHLYSRSQWMSERSLISSIPMYHYTPPFSLSLRQRYPKCYISHSIFGDGSS